MTIIEFIAKKSIFLMIICIFIIGWMSNTLFSNIQNFDLEKPSSFSFFKAKELDSPFNRIKKDQIHVFKDKIVLDVENAKWAEFTDTNSMDPVLDKGSNSIEITPSSMEDIYIGDIIVYKPKYLDNLIVHRVINISSDKNGWYAITKGDNLKKQDPEKIRFNQIKGVLVGIIY